MNLKITDSSTHYRVSAFIRKDYLPVVLMSSYTRALTPQMKAGMVPVRELSCEGFLKGFDERAEVSVNNEIIDVEYSQANLIRAPRYIRESQIAIYRKSAHLPSPTDDASKRQIDLYV
jgi:hypothetical protein